MKEDALSYVVQKAFIKKGDEVFVLNDPEEGLDFPGGKIQEGEDNLENALKREVLEETGLEIAIDSPFITGTEVFPPTHRLAGKRVILIGYKCNYINGEVVLSEEHNNFKWITRDNYNEVDDGTSYFGILSKYFSTL
jgi:8-oxo-dGTP diphosphatase